MLTHAINHIWLPALSCSALLWCVALCSMQKREPEHAAHDGQPKSKRAKVPTEVGGCGGFGKGNFG